MTPNKRGRGRPKSEQTVEREREQTHQKKLLRNIPTNQCMSLGEKMEVAEVVKNLDEWEKQILANYPHPIPKKLAIELGSLGDDAMNGHEQEVIEKYNSLKQGLRNGQIAGGQRTAEKSMQRKNLIFKKNSILIQKLGTPRWNPSRIANKLHDEWDSVKPHQRLPGETTSLDRRGDDDGRLSKKQLNRWLA